MEYYSAMKKNRLPIHSKTWENLLNIEPSERSLVWKTHTLWSYWSSRTGKTDQQWRNQRHGWFLGYSVVWQRGKGWRELSRGWPHSASLNRCLGYTGTSICWDSSSDILWDAGKAVLRGKCIATNTTLKKKKGLKSVTQIYILRGKKKEE